MDNKKLYLWLLSSIDELIDFEYDLKMEEEKKDECKREGFDEALHDLRKSWRNDKE